MATEGSDNPFDELDPAELPDDVDASDIWSAAPDPESVPTLDFPRSLDGYEWSIHFGKRVIEDVRPPDLETVADVLESGEFMGEFGERDYRFEKEYDGVTIRVVVAITSAEPIRPLLVTAYPIIERLVDATACDRFDAEEINRAYAASYFHGNAAYGDGGQIPDDWSLVEFDRPLEVNGHEIVGNRHRRYPRCERCGKRLNYGSAQQHCAARGDLHD